MVRPISPPTTASSGSLGSIKRGPRPFSVSRVTSRMTLREDEYLPRAAAAVEDERDYAPSHSRRVSVASRHGPISNSETRHDELYGSSDASEGLAMSEDQKAESIIQGLCDSENGFHLLLDRIKQDIFTTKEAVAFLKKRAQIEEDYAKAMLKLAQSGTGVKNEGKEGSFGNAWTQFVKIHEQVGETRLKFSEAVSDVSEQLAALHKNTERSRKQLKEAGHKHSRIVQEAEAALEKAKTRYESTSEDWERAILQKEQQIERDGFGKYIGSAPSGLHRSMSTKNVSGKGLPNPMNRWKTQNPVKLQKNEDDARTKAALANDNYKTQLQQTNTIRATYFQNHLPRFIRLLKETSDECDVGLQINLVKYAQDLEASLMKEATTLSPLENDRPGIVKIVENIDNEGDFEEYVQSYMQEAKDAEKGDHQYTPYSMSSEAYLIVSARPSFGLELVALLDRDGIPIPVVVTNCIQFVEQHGLKVQGLYRMSAPTLQVQKLRTALNRDPDTPRLNDYSADIHVVTNVLKLYFRELPDTLFPKAMYKELLDAARIEDERLRLINIHELINQLHDANYATLQALTRHLWTVSLNESHNRMTAANLSIVWGPSLLDSPAPSSDPNDIKLQTRILEVVIANFEHIFDTEGEA